jgi:hypothetical protein
VTDAVAEVIVAEAVDGSVPCLSVWSHCSPDFDLLRPEFDVLEVSLATSLEVEVTVALKL